MRFALVFADLLLCCLCSVPCAQSTSSGERSRQIEFFITQICLMDPKWNFTLDFLLFLSLPPLSLSLWISSTIPLSVLVLISSSWRCQLWPDVTFQLRSRQLSTMVERESSAKNTVKVSRVAGRASTSPWGGSLAKSIPMLLCKWRQKRTAKRENLSSHIRARQPLKVGVRMTRFCA